MADNGTVLWELALLVSAGLGSLFLLLAAWGNLRVPNVIARMHSAGMGSTLGIFLLLAATGVYFFVLDSEPDTLVLLGVLGFFLLLTAPVATSAMARASLRMADSRESEHLILDEFRSRMRPTVKAADRHPALEYVERLHSDSAKWRAYDPSIIPLWVADMDFKSPRPILQSLHDRLEHGVFGYGGREEELAEVFCQHLARTYQWQVTPQDLLFLPGLVSGLNVVSAAIGEPGASAMTLEPVYPPFFSAPLNQGKQLQSVALSQARRGGHLHYEIDLDRCIHAADKSTQLFLLCNPHNPVGRSYAEAELRMVAEFCLERDIVLCSDEIHCELLLDDTRHIPVASLDPDIAQNTITLMAPSKTFNIPGLGCSVAVIQNPRLRAVVQGKSSGIVPHVNVLGYMAAIAAYGDPECREWAGALCRFLTDNRDYLLQELQRRFPEARSTRPESTYLAWIDFAPYVEGSAYQFFRDKAAVALSQGSNYCTQGGDSFVRLNLGTRRENLAQALDRMRNAIVD